MCLGIGRFVKKCPFLKKNFLLIWIESRKNNFQVGGRSRPPPTPLNYSNALLSNKGDLLMKETALLQKQFGSLFHYKYTIRLHSHGKDKTKFNELCLFQRHSHIFWVRYFLLKFHAPTDITVLCRWFFSVLSNFCGYICQCTSCIQCRVDLMLSEDMYRALA